ncbi:transposase [Anopheles sinensis]|uniref:Transposase n=1 Tax=Anopheles sinensis TaxID=74873 RepID=A0A084WFP7_ANOSI|nr:transposase [Anopheles sinensis]
MGKGATKGCETASSWTETPVKRCVSKPLSWACIAPDGAIVDPIWKPDDDPVGRFHPVRLDLL